MLDLKRLFGCGKPDDSISDLGGITLLTIKGRAAIAMGQPQEG